MSASALSHRVHASPAIVSNPAAYAWHTTTNQATTRSFTTHSELTLRRAPVSANLAHHNPHKHVTTASAPIPRNDVEFPADEELMNADSSSTPVPNSTTPAIVCQHTHTHTHVSMDALTITSHGVASHHHMECKRGTCHVRRVR
jgi:hypothetical protein